MELRCCVNGSIEMFAENANPITTALPGLERRPRASHLGGYGDPTRGALLSEVELSKRLGVSRTPIGAALQRLAREGLVTILPRRGIVVTELSLNDQLRALELRREIARYMARVGARRATPTERAELDATAKSLLKAAKAGDEEALMRADKAYLEDFARSTIDPAR